MNTILLSNTNTLPDKLKSICEKCDINIITIEAKDGANENWWNERIHKLFVDNNIERVIIPVSIPEDANNNLGLEIGMHIRLDYLLPIERRCIPIVFLSDLSFTKLMKENHKNSSNPHLLLLTDGVVACDLFELEDVLQKNIDGLNPAEYHLFLKQLNVNRRDGVGNHDIANAWGCYRLAKAIGHEEIVFKSPQVREKLGQLYAKWLICQNNIIVDGADLTTEVDPVLCEGKKILFIDDKSDEGWGDLMRYIFRAAGNGFVCVDAGKYKKGTFDYKSFFDECDSYIDQRWDLILIDLRLNPETEDVDVNSINPQKLSGYKLIDEFLKWNAGFQIVAFTASNKIWNIDAALQRGVRGYYIKESPLFSSDVSQSKATYEKMFVKTVNKCLSNGFLYDVYDKICIFYDGFKENPTELCEEVYSQLKIAFGLIASANSKEKYAYAFIALYSTIEIITHHLLDRNGWFLLPSGVKMHIYKHDDKTDRHRDTNKEYTEKNDPPKWMVLTALLKQEWEIGNWAILSGNFYEHTRKRNSFIHPNKGIAGDYSDIYTEKAFIALFDDLYRILDYLY